MAISVYTSDASGLLSAIKRGIDESAIRTWSYDKDGDFTHTAEQWTNNAWLRPRILDGRLVFLILPPRGKNISSLLYAIYHGRFVEMLLNHYDGKFTKADVSALPSLGDVVKG